MLQIPRSLAHTVRAVFRRLTRRSSAAVPVVSFETGPRGLAIRLHHTEITAEFHQPGSYPAESLVIPLSALADFEGKKKDVVTLDSTASGVQVRWQDGVVPQVREYPVPGQKTPSPLPDPPGESVTNEPGFFQALADATGSASHEAIRYALDHIQLRGRSGQIVTTDGKQLLMQSGFRFGWTDDVLIPASAVFTARELPQQEAVAIGKTATHVTMTAGSWTLHCPINTQSRYPSIEQVIPSLIGSISRAQFDPTDSAFLSQVLPRLPGKTDDDSRITLDLNGEVFVRARGSEDGRVTELHLAKSQVTGKPVRVSLERQRLAQALHLGLGELCVVNAETPVVFRGHTRQLIVMPLSKEGALGPSDNVVRISSVSGESVRPVRSRSPEPVLAADRHEPIVAVNAQEPATSAPQTFLPVHGTRKSSRSVNKMAAHKAVGTLATLVTEGEALREELRRAYTRTHQLLTALKKHRRQSKLVQSTLATLRQLKNVAG